MDDVKRIEESTIQTEWYSARACLYHGLKLAVEKTRLTNFIVFRSLNIVRPVYFERKIISQFAYV